MRGVGAREIRVGNEVTFEVDAGEPADALTRADKVLFELSWPTAAVATQIR